MSPALTLADRHSLADLRVFLSRAARVDDGSVRLIATEGVLAVYVAVLHPVGLLDETPTVLGLRTFALAEPADFDVVVPIGSLAQRIERVLGNEPEDAASVAVTLPPQVHSVSWAAISPPRGGWRAHGETTAELMERTARAGIDEVAVAVPESTGEQLVHRVRSEVWSRPVDDLEFVPAGAAFAAMSLGFLGEDAVSIFATGTWTRLTTERGHVLVRRRAWTLAR